MYIYILYHIFPFFQTKAGKVCRLFGQKASDAVPMREANRAGPAVERNVRLTFCAARFHSIGKNMDCVAEFALRRKTRPGMPFFENEGRPMKLA